MASSSAQAALTRKTALGGTHRPPQIFAGRSRLPQLLCASLALTLLPHGCALASGAISILQIEWNRRKLRSAAPACTLQRYVAAGVAGPRPPRPPPPVRA